MNAVQNHSLSMPGISGTASSITSSIGHVFQSLGSFASDTVQKVYQFAAPYFSKAAFYTQAGLHAAWDMTQYAAHQTAIGALNLTQLAGAQMLKGAQAVGRAAGQALSGTWGFIANGATAAGGQMLAVVQKVNSAVGQALASIWAGITFGVQQSCFATKNFVTAHPKELLIIGGGILVSAAAYHIFSHMKSSETHSHAKNA